MAVVEGSDALLPQKALDLGCGHGTNSNYMAQRGWDGTRIHFLPRAVAGRCSDPPLTGTRSTGADLLHKGPHSHFSRPTPSCAYRPSLMVMKRRSRSFGRITSCSCPES